MCELYALSAAQPCLPRDDLNILQGHGTEPFGNLEGWGIAWEAEAGPVLQKAAQSAAHAGGFPALVTRLPPAPIWIVHLRAASTGGVTHENTQPYLFKLDGQDCIYAHNGDLTDVDNHPEFMAHRDELNGNADSECGLIILKHRLRDAGSIPAQWTIFQTFGAEMRERGLANFIVKIGANIFAQSDRRKPVGTDEMSTPGLTILEEDGVIRLSSEPLGPDYQPMREGEQIWIRAGEIIDRN